MTRDESYMLMAIEQAELALAEGEVPVGAVVVRGDELLAKCRNRRDGDRRPTAHAELLAIEAAAAALGDWRLEGCELFVTLEPCAMCAGAANAARLRRVVFGAFDPEFGCCGSALDLTRLPNSRVEELLGGVLEDQCQRLLRDFFDAKRG